MSSYDNQLKDPKSPMMLFLFMFFFHCFCKWSLITAIVLKPFGLKSCYRPLQATEFITASVLTVRKTCQVCPEGGARGKSSSLHSSSIIRSLSPWSCCLRCSDALSSRLPGSQGTELWWTDWPQTHHKQGSEWGHHTNTDAHIFWHSLSGSCP